MSHRKAAGRAAGRARASGVGGGLSGKAGGSGSTADGPKGQAGGGGEEVGARECSNPGGRRRKDSESPGGRGSRNKPGAARPGRGGKRRAAARDSSDSGGRRVTAVGAEDLNKALRGVVEKLKIRSVQKSRASRQVNEVVDRLLRYIRKESGGCFSDVTKLASGSYYENVKISEPNEFDIMIVIPIKRIQFLEVDTEGAFYQVTFKRKPGANPLSQFVCNDTLSAEEMICHLRKLIKEGVKTLTEYNIKLERRKPGCPAVTLQIEDKEYGPISLDMVLALEVHSQSWPGSTTKGLKIEGWLGKKVRKEFRMKPFYLVPKHPLNLAEGACNQSQKEMWRISFSHIEKMMLLNHGSLKTCCESESSKCCRKPCLKLLKNLIQKLKEKNPRILANVVSYHAKTTLLHACVKRPQDEQWSFEELDTCFLQLVDDFIEYLKASNLPHFFIPTFNLFNPSSFKSKCRETLLRLIESERKNNFQILSRSR
ncbi:cyclic GMP-AMP synthase-like [Stegostoma tigrinum]|uniref:cyclic GMP-AMP synthase-like n=1 Tax=Stegostoma tigrinum TaxID=3053191 RepID=UPI0028707D9C|nr:cyclic GMP-AMP synthase-like [Stegostoma tigrinum]